MKNKSKKRKVQPKLNRKGFSLVEVLIAVGILILITVPLAMNMIASSQMNSTSKQVAASSDLTTALMEVMQSVDLSDILTDINGGDSDEYGSKLDYLLTKNALKNYDQNAIQAYEVHDLGNGSYKIAIKQGEGEAALDPTKITASIRSRITGAAERNYFVGQNQDWDGDGKLNEYAFLIQNVENDEMNVDILATIVPEQTFSIVNITSMSQTEVVYVRQDKNLDERMASEFFKAHEMYKALKGGVMTIESKPESWFFENMERTITVTLDQDPFSEAVTIVVSATYTIDTTALPAGDRTITKTLGSFTTNSTSEFARGTYVYYYPLMNNQSTGEYRDHFVIKNENELSTPVYLIALSSDASEDFSAIANYNPTLEVYELSSEIYTERSRTTVCSNVADNYWKEKALYPHDNRSLSIKTLGNLSDQQTLYTLTIRVYKHQDNNLSAGHFTPKDKDLLVETKGTFIDTSELLDITSDNITGDVLSPKKAVFSSNPLVYNGEDQTGVYGVGVKIVGVTHATNAGVYEATATPLPGYYWSDGSDGARTISWAIARDPSARYEKLEPVYNGEKISGVDGQWIVLDGVHEAIDQGQYTAYVQPDQNHAWADGTYGKKTVNWTLAKRPIDIEWNTGPNLDTWVYDGQEHKGTYTLHNVISSDLQTLVVLEGVNKIKNVGTVEAKINGFSDLNYCIGSGATHTLTVTNIAGAYVELRDNQSASEVISVVYCGENQSPVAESEGVIFSGHVKKKNVDKYTMYATLLPGYVWEDTQTNETRTFQWEIVPHTVQLVWGQSTWIYNGTSNIGTCFAHEDSVFPGDSVDIILENNSIKNVGTVEARAIGTDNKNYAVPDPIETHILTVNPAPYASFKTYDTQYSGQAYTGVVGSNIEFLDDNHTQVNVLYDETVLYDGIHKERPVIAYAAQVKPQPNYCWSDSTNDTAPRTAYWTIHPKRTSYYKVYDIMYTGIYDEVTGKEVGDIGIIGKDFQTVDSEGNPIDARQTKPGTYTTTIRPLPNHVWEESGDGRDITETWTLEEYIPPKPFFEEDTFIYNGKSQEPKMFAESMSIAYKLTEDGWWPGKETGADCPEDENGNRKCTTYAAVHTGTYYYWVVPATADDLIERDPETGEPLIDPETNKPIYYAPIESLPVGLEPICLSWTIQPRVVDIQFDQNRWIYDAQTHYGTARIVNLCNNDEYAFTYANNAVKDYTPGHQFTITAISNPYNDYCLPEDPNLLTGIAIIEKRTLDINWGQLTFDHYEPSTYYRVDPNPKYDPNAQSSGICTEDLGRVDFVTDNEERNPAGKQTVYIIGLSGEQEHNYKLPADNLLTAEMWVKPAPLAKVNFVSGLKYNGKSQTGIDEDTYVLCSYVSGPTTGTNAGNYTIVCKPDDNYAWGDYSTDEREFTWKIAKIKNPGVCTSAPKATNPTYNGTAQSMCTAGTVQHGKMEYILYSGSATNAVTSWSTSIPKATSAGSYYVGYRAGATTNYYASDEIDVVFSMMGFSPTAYIHAASTTQWDDDWSSTKSITMFKYNGISILSGEPSRTVSYILSNKSLSWEMRAVPAQNYSWGDEENASPSASANNHYGDSGARTATFWFTRANTAYFQMNAPSKGTTQGDKVLYTAKYTQVGTLPSGTFTHNHYLNNCGCGDFYITAYLDALHNWKDQAAVSYKKYSWAVP